tara:strand:- start:422 stop:775 length:354 start_codon:yes stop_codon:yes gene_type:complete
MFKSVIIGLISAILLSIVAYSSLVAGSFVSSKIIGGIISMPGMVFLIPGLPFVFLIDILPMGYIFPGGGASGVFGSILLFATIFWSILFSYRVHKGKWPFKNLNKSKQTDALKRASV